MPGRCGSPFQDGLGPELYPAQWTAGPDTGLGGSSCMGCPRRHRAAIAAIPLGTDLRQIVWSSNATRIADPLLAQEVADFTREWLRPLARPTVHAAPGPWLRISVMTSPGSALAIFSTHLAFTTLTAHAPLAAWPYEPTRDAGLAPGANGAGYPTCRQWWSDPGRGCASDCCPRSMLDC